MLLGWLRNESIVRHPPRGSVRAPLGLEVPEAPRCRVLNHPKCQGVGGRKSNTADQLKLSPGLP